MKKYKVELKAKTIIEFELEDDDDVEESMKISIEDVWQDESPFLAKEYEWKVLETAPENTSVYI